MRRFVRALAAVACAVVLASACSAADDGPAGPEPEGGDSEGDSATPFTRDDADLVIWADRRRADALADVVAAFGDEQDVTTSVQVVPEQDLQTAFINANTADVGPDVVVGTHGWIGAMVQNGAIDPVLLSDADQGRYVDVALAGVTFNDQVYGLPYAFESLALLRNTELAPGAPATVEDLVAAAGAAGTEHRLCVPVGPEGIALSLHPFYSSAGGYLFGTTAEGDDDPNDLGVGQTGSLTAAGRLAGLGASGALTAEAPEVTLTLFGERRCPFLLAGPSALEAVAASGQPFEVSPVPGFAGLQPARPFTDVHAFFVASKGRSRELAQMFVLDTVNSPETMRVLYDAGPLPPAMTEALEAVQATAPTTARFAEAASTGQLLPAIPQVEEVWEPLSQAEAAIIGGADPESTMQTAGQRIADALR